MTTPDRTRAEFRELVAGSETVVARVEVPLSVDVSPLAAYATLAGDDYGFLLESAEKTAASDPDGAFSPAAGPEERHARFSFVGYDPDAVVTVDADGDDVTALRDSRAVEFVDTGEGDVVDRLRNALPSVDRRGFPERDRQLLDGGLVGFVAYDAVYDLWLEEVGVERPASPVPDAQFALTTRTLVFDHLADDVSLVFTPIVAPGDDPDAVYDEIHAEADRVRDALDGAPSPDTGGFERRDERAGSKDAYERAVARAKDAVYEGDIYQAVISRTREIDGQVDPLGLYESMRSVNPSPYMYLLSHGDRTIVGASPETLVSVDGETVSNNPIAGTCARGRSPVEDRRLAGEMLADEKERAEHTMLVDLARNDVRRVARPGSVDVPEFMRVLKYSHVQHIESTVTGTLREDRDAFDAVRASFPAGTLSGAPKIRAMELIHEFEERPRGVYGGGVGYVSWQGDADFAIVIRTVTIDHGDTDTLRVRAGAGVVADSDPEREYAETESKMDGALAAIERIESPAPEVSR
ncbi:anthranilate synthase component I [Halanaeroarchaeum sulfurireducens]|uniref:Anthranilate synthase component 1 n=1 Tax=Halanaeroarchaeum sulfurireducens TaxID=1604004 RepID=A0A0F7PBW7_9EURY|nr:anthranilate synthase, aminase component [Halanaeroarchaeum sulfurireducens]ALG82606.1 anthranilate synthase, aminase component [Halanaeroarchaeum sulfurireducens]